MSTLYVMPISRLLFCDNLSTEYNNVVNFSTLLTLDSWLHIYYDHSTCLLHRASDISRGCGAANSSKSAKSREIHKNTQNPAKFAKNLTKYMSPQHIQTCQLSRFCRESHDFLSFLTVSRQGSQSHGFFAKIFLKGSE